MYVTLRYLNLFRVMFTIVSYVHSNTFIAHTTVAESNEINYTSSQNRYIRKARTFLLTQTKTKKNMEFHFDNEQFIVVFCK